MDWSQADVNRVFTDTLVLSNPDRLPFYSYDVPHKSFSDEGFYEVTVGPVVCKSEISKNVSSSQSLCSDGKLYNNTDHCIMRVNERSDVNGCRDMTHLQHCEKEICQPGFFKCKKGHCISSSLLCDGRKHCTHGDDELFCGNLTCPGLYRCQQSTTCLLFDEVCDNIRQCPHGDDEVGCYVTCPIGCSCEGLVFICHQKEVETIFRDLSIEARKLDLSSSLFPNNDLIANWLFIMNLGVADMLMGVYLGIIAFVDMYYSGNYILHDREWRDSTVCKFAGILAAISCEASVCFVMLTTFDCYLMVQFPFGRWRITYKTAKVSTLVCWLFVIIIAVVPIFETAYFSNMFYSRTAVCLALPFSRQKVSGWEYSTAIFVFFNCTAFIVIAWCQLSIYQIAKSSNRIMTKRTKQDLTLARRLFLIVLTDFLCWFPVGIMGILAMAGQVFPSEVYSWVAVFVMPLNAALNPFLYTFSTIKQKPNILGKMSSKIFQMSKVKDRRKDASDEICMASVFINNAQILQTRHITLRELFATRKLTIKESIRLVSQLTAALAYLHHRYLTLCQPVSLDNLVVFMDRKKIERIKVISQIKNIRNELDTAQDVDNIGQITKLVLRNTRKLQEEGHKY
ncbi:uncharacterized protein LOC127709600 [Mytilus californianus]|uniref:uncharacterized protein LOC127709600 n=1 Tax=Mytilus californianus TaxID=6549 RepID=UPI002247BECC|nr:uncharacterized protein LOC127709600 [Mytilus californianus]